MLGLEGELPESVDTDSVESALEAIRCPAINLIRRACHRFDEEEQLVMHRRQSLPFHSNGMTFCAFDAQR